MSFFTWNETAVTLCSLSLILLSGFVVTRVTKRLSLPNVSGYILAGILIGPCVLHLVPDGFLARVGFVSDLALSFIAFGVGRFLKKDVLRAAGRGVFLVTVLESLLAGVLVSAAMYWGFHMDLRFSLLLGAIATATAPASTMMTIDQYHARGEFVNLLLQVVAFDDVVCLLVFSLASAFVGAQDGSCSARDILVPLALNVLMLAAGFCCALLLRRLLTPQRSRDNRLILVIVMLTALSGVCAALNVSPLLACMLFGAVYRNLSDDKELFRQINNFTPPVLSMFFVVSGMNLDVRSLCSFGLVGVGYFVVRIAGKYLGAYLGCRMAHTDAGTRRYLGAALVPQAGVAIGLAFLAQRMLPPSVGDALLTIILSSSVLYELIGPACAKFALLRSGAIERQPNS
ncbi:MAG: cation:proton antiporter [Clostridia bacterium]|nr:cation:proton antiporter [Clostridia bacterium]